MKIVPLLAFLFYLSSGNVQNSSNEQEFFLQHLLARASHPGFHPLSAVSNRLFSKLLEQMSGDLTYEFLIS